MFLLRRQRQFLCRLDALGRYTEVGAPARVFAHPEITERGQLRGACGMRCPDCQRELPPRAASCAHCGARSSSLPRDPGAADSSTTHIVVRGRADAGAESPILGFAVFFAESAEVERGAPDSRLGRVFPLREHSMLFVGRAAQAGSAGAPRDLLRRDGTQGAPDSIYMFPSTSAYRHVSRKHVTIELAPNAEAYVTDHSAFGIYLLHAQRHLVLGAGEVSRVHRIVGDEVLILGASMNSEEERERGLRSQVQIIHTVQGSSAETGAPGGMHEV